MEFLQHLSESFGKLGEAKTFILFLLILLVVVPIYLLKNTIGEILKKVSFSKTVKVPKVSEVKYHDIFNLITEVRLKIEGIRYTTHGDFDSTKSVLIKLMIQNQLKETRKALLCLIAFDGIDCMGSQQLKSEMIRKLNKANQNYTDVTYHEFLEMGISSEDAYFILEEYAQFRNEVMSGFLDRAESICSNNIYSTNFHRLSASFEVIALGLHLIAKDSIYTCNKINGRYKKYTHIQSH